jgi:NRPS condensation-like uncharacterized protein
VRLDHTAGDGWSGVEVVHLLAETYSGFLRDPARPVQPRLEPRPTQADVWNSLSEEQRAAAAGAPAPGFSKWKVKLARGTDPTFQARELTLSADRVAAIREYAHARGATINEALIAALLRSVSSISPPPASVQPGVSISADTRRIGHGANLRRIANIATTQTVTMEFVQGESYEQTLRHVADGTRPWRERLWSIGGSLGQRPDDPAAPKPIVLRAMFGLLTWSMRIGHAAALLTMNVGAFDEERVAFGPARPVKVVAMGPIPRFAGFAMYISSYRGAATLWMGYRENRTATAVIERCLAGIDEELALAVPGPW